MSALGKLTPKTGTFTNLWRTQARSAKKINDAYRAHMALKAPVTYWTEKCKNHKQSIRRLGFITILSAFATAISAGGIFFFLIKPSFPSEVHAETAIPVWGLGLLFIVSTLGIWITRLFTKMFISNLHLREDAYERIVMTQAYIALLSMKGLDGSDRKIALSTLFRPSASGFIRDDGPAGLLELLSKVRNQ